MNNLKEVDVGITEFVGSTAPFNGIIKAKFSDFQVHEIDPEGKVAVLTDITVPEAPLDETVEKILQEDDSELETLIPADQWKELNEMMEKDDRESAILIDVTEKSKEDRTKIHVLVKKTFGKMVNSTTTEKDGKKFIKISLFRNNGE